MTASRTRLAAAALSSLLLLAACGQQSVPELLAQARIALEQQDPQSAQIHLKNALQKDGSLAEARYLLGRALLEAGDPQGALVEFNKAADGNYRPDELAPMHARALLARREDRALVERYGKTQLTDVKAQSVLLQLLAEAQFRLGKEDLGQDLLQQSLKADPKNAAAEVMLARGQVRAGDRDGARKRLEALRAEQRLDANGWRMLADLAWSEKREFKPPRDLLEQGLVQHAKATDLHLSLLTLLISQRDIDAAEAQLKASRSKLGAVPGLRYFAAVIEMERGRLEPAYAEVEQLLKLSPDDGRVQLLAGQIEFLRDRLLQAESHLVRAVAAMGNSERPRLLLAQTYLRMDDAPRALQTLQPLLEERSSNARVYSIAGEAHQQVGEVRRAQELFRRASELDPKDLRSRTMMAVNQLGQGREAEGLEELRDIAGSNDNPVADMALVSTFIRKGDFEQAMKAIDGIDRKLPDRALAPTLRGNLLAAQGKADDARVAYAEALRRDPKHLPAAQALARLEIAAKQPDKASAHLATVAKADPDNVVTQLAWLGARFNAGEAQPAIEQELKDLVRRAPQVARARVALARMQLRGGDVAAATTTLQEGVAVLPKEGELIEQLADLQARQRDFTLAAKTLGKLVELRPGSPDPLLRLAETEAKAEKPREALVTVRKALALRPNHGPALRMQIALEAELGNIAAARRLAKDMQAQQGLEALGSAVEGDLETSQQQFSVAAGAYRRAISRNPGLPDMAAKLHRVLVADGKAPEADSFAQSWLKERPTDASFMAYLGDAALQAQDMGKARGFYERALALRPGSPLVLNNLGWMTLQQGDAKKAESLLREGLKVGASEAALHDTLAEVLSVQGQHEPALAAQRQAVALDPNPGYRVGLARRLLAAKRADAARDELLLVQKIGKRYPGQAEVSALLAQIDGKTAP